MALNLAKSKKKKEVDGKKAAKIQHPQARWLLKASRDHQAGP